MDVSAPGFPKDIGEIKATRASKESIRLHGLGVDKNRWVHLPDLAGEVFRFYVASIQELFFYYSDPLMAMLFIKQGYIRYHVFNPKIAQLKSKVYSLYQMTPGNYPVQVLGCWYAVLQFRPNGNIVLRLAPPQKMRPLIDEETGTISIDVNLPPLGGDDDNVIDSSEFPDLSEFMYVVAGHVIVMTLQLRDRNMEFDVPREAGVSHHWTSRFLPVIKDMFERLKHVVKNCPLQSFDGASRVLKDANYKKRMLEALTKIATEAHINPSNSLPFDEGCLTLPSPAPAVRSSESLLSYDTFDFLAPSPDATAQHRRRFPTVSASNAQAFPASTLPWHIEVPPASHPQDSNGYTPTQKETGTATSTSNALAFPSSSLPWHVEVPTAPYPKDGNVPPFNPLPSLESDDEDDFLFVHTTALP